MTADDPAADEITMDQLVESFIGRLRAGEDVSIDSYQRQHPHLADEIGQVFPSLQMLEGCRPNNDRSTTQPISAEDIPPNRLGDYCIIQEVGRGGMGIVYEGRTRGDAAPCCP